MASPSAYNLRRVADVSGLSGTRSGRLLQSIRRDMDLKGQLFRNRKRNEEILSVKYQEGDLLGSASEWQNIRENALNLPYRNLRWMESQATSKKMVVKVNRDAGAGQRPGGPSDDATGMWVGIALGRVAYEAGWKREFKALLNEVIPRGTSVMQIGYHEEVITLEEARESGKDAQSIVGDVLGLGDLTAKPGQEHAEISRGLTAMADDPMFQRSAGIAGVQAVQARASSHDLSDFKDETYDGPKTSTRLIRRKAWMQKKRVGEDVGWAPWVYDVEDSPYWWERNVWTVAEVKRSDLFTAKFKKQVEGYDGRNVSGVFQAGETPNTESMGSDARQAMSEDILDDDERMVEWFAVWYRCPDMKAGGYRKIVCAECPDEFIERDDSNPYVDDLDYGLIKGFYPFYDFTPVLSSLTVPERTCGIPPMAAAMSHFEKLAEYNRIRQEAALKGATRITQIHSGMKDAKGVLDALNRGDIGYAFIGDGGLLTSDNQMVDALKTYSHTGTDPEIDRQADKEKMDCLNMLGMPPAIFQGMGTAETLGQDQQGIAAGEQESGSILAYFEERMADVLIGLRGIMRGNYDDEDFQLLLGEEGAAVMKAWQTGTSDDGDEVTVTFGSNAQAQATVEKKQLMEAITLEKGEIEPITGASVYDTSPLFEELHRRLDVGAPKKSPAPMQQLQQIVMALAGQIEQLTGVNPLTGEAAPGAKPQGADGGEGPNPSEGDGPTTGNLQAGAVRDTVPQAPEMAAAT